MNPDKPFKFRGGTGHQVAIYNRIAFIKRVEWISGVSLRDKEQWFLHAVDMEMFGRHYKDKDLAPIIDENEAQRMAVVVKDLEKDKELSKANKELGSQVASAFKSYSKRTAPTVEESGKEMKKDVRGIIGTFFHKLKGGTNGKTKHE